MESLIFDSGQEDKPEREFSEEDSDEEAFMEGYSDEEEVPTCDECGTALRGKKITKTIEGEKHIFCSKECAQDFEESLG